MSHPNLLAVTIVAIAALALSGCSRNDDKARSSDVQASASASATAAPSTSTTASVAATGSAPTPPSGLMNLQERFQAEAKNRATGTLSPETVYDAIAARKIELRKRQQHMAAPFAAKYCLGAETGDDVALSVCEFSSEGEAKRGQDISQKMFATVPNRKLLLNGATMLTVRVGNKTAANEALAAQIVKTFQELKFTK